MVVLPTVSVVLESLGSFRIIAWNLPGLACIMLASNHLMAVVDSAIYMRVYDRLFSIAASRYRVIV